MSGRYGLLTTPERTVPRPPRDHAPEQFTEYEAAARHCQEAERHALDARVRRAWEFARLASATLRRQFGAARVVGFGSHVHPESRTPWSDVDIATSGLRPADTSRAIGVVLDLDAGIRVNLVDLKACRAPVLRAIERRDSAMRARHAFLAARIRRTWPIRTASIPWPPDCGRPFTVSAGIRGLCRPIWTATRVTRNPSCLHPKPATRRGHGLGVSCLT